LEDDSSELEVAQQIKNLDMVNQRNRLTDPKFNEEIITPYVIVNKTDLSFYVKRLFEKDRRDSEIQKHRRYKELIAEEKEIEANLHKRKCLVNQYKLE